MLTSCSGRAAVQSPTDTPMPAAQPITEDTPALMPAESPTGAATSNPALPAISTPAVTPPASAFPAPTYAPSATVLPTITVGEEEAGPSEAPARLVQGRWQQTIGDCDLARRTFAELLAAGTDAASAAEARYRMAQCYLRDDAYAEAWATLAELLESDGNRRTAPPADPHRPPAQFLQGEALAALANWPAAEAAYTAYLPMAPELAYLTQQRIAVARRAQGNLDGAAEAYRAALALSPDWSNTTAIRRGLADLALEQGHPEEAVAQYDALRGGETTGAWAAEMQYLAGNALARPAQLLAQVAALLAPPGPSGTSGPSGAPATPITATTPTPIPVPSEALARWQAAVDADITSRYAHSAIVALLDAGAQVDELQRGLANYHNGAYALAIAAFDRLRAADPTGGQGQAWYTAGLSYLALGDLDLGLAELDHFIANFPNSPQWGEAWLAQGRARAAAGQTAEAIATYRRLAESRPDAAEAPLALWRAAALEDAEPPQAAAAETYLAAARRYPGATNAWRAYQAAGLIAFRLGDWPRAAETWREMAGRAELPAFSQPVAYFWLGRALSAGGDPEAAGRAWQEAQKAGPGAFYGLRAAAWATGSPAFEQAAPLAAPASPARSPDAASEISTWLRTWAGAGELIDSFPEYIAADGDWRRGKTLMALGLRPQALAQWERVRTRYANDPWSMAALALAFRDENAYRLSLLSAERVAALSGKLMREAPAALQRLAYPFPYADLIRAEATARELDPRLLAAIIRQESNFEGGATSVAGAQGLMQVIPGTAEGIARQLNWPDFEPQHAYLPYVNVAFGAFYVHQWLTHFDGSLVAALAAYNGGPGNATVWYQWAPDDDDLLAALININETRTYVQAVWTNYEAYRRLYRW